MKKSSGSSKPRPHYAGGTKSTKLSKQIIARNLLSHPSGIWSPFLVARELNVTQESMSRWIAAGMPLSG